MCPHRKQPTEGDSDPAEALGGVKRSGVCASSLQSPWDWSLEKGLRLLAKSLIKEL